MTAEAQAVLSNTTVVDTNPATGEILAELPCAGAEEVQAAVRRARTAQPGWQAMPVAKRIAVVKKFQGLLRDRTRDIAELICREAGKPTVEAISTEILVVLDAAEFCMRTAHRFLRDQPVPHGNIAMKAKRGVLAREPYGVIGIISPWNYPFSTPAVETIAALVTGNAVVIKPSEFTPLAALELQKLFHAAGLDPDLLQVVVGEGPTGAALIDSGVDKLIFTGSVATGKRVAETAARRLLPVVLELGGKDPMIVLRRRRPRGGHQRSALGRLHECRPDVPVGRALLRATQHLRSVSADHGGEDWPNCASATASTRKWRWARSSTSGSCARWRRTWMTQCNAARACWLGVAG